MQDNLTEITTENRSDSNETHTAADMRIGAVNHKDVLTAAEYREVFGKRALSPEEDLMAAVLTDAIETFQRCAAAEDSKGKKCFAEAEAWIISDDSDWVFSFANCCEAAGIDPSYLRRGLARWREERSAKKPSRRSGPARKAVAVETGVSAPPPRLVAAALGG